MFNRKYKGGDTVPYGSKNYFVMKNGHHIETVEITSMHFPTLKDPNQYYIRAC